MSKPTYEELEHTVAEVTQKIATLERENADLRASKDQYEAGKQKFISTSCSICLGSFYDYQDKALTRCDHVYHKQCITTWLKNHPICPLCRKSVNKYTVYPKACSHTRWTLNRFLQQWSR